MQYRSTPFESFALAGPFASQRIPSTTFEFSEFEFPPFPEPPPLPEPLPDVGEGVGVAEGVALGVGFTATFTPFDQTFLLPLFTQV